MSSYRLISLDAQTGSTMNYEDFIGDWGLGMPQIYVADDGRAMLLHRRLVLPNAGVSDVQAEAGTTSNEKKAAWLTQPGDTPFDVRTLLPTGESLPWLDAIPVQANERTIFNKSVFWNGLLGKFGCASQDGKRYAFEFSESRGDFPEVIYDFFIVYDTGRPIAIVHMKSLPRDQSWSALSPDGHYFVGGNPNALNLYALP